MFEKVLKNMYIDFEDIEDRVCIDARTKEEFTLMNFFDFNIPLITKEYHYILRKCKIIAPILIIMSIVKRKEYIDLELIKLSNNKTRPLLFACSKGRLRSPSLCIYAKLKGIDAKVLKGGIRHYFSEEEQSKYFNNIKDCIIYDEILVGKECPMKAHT